MNTFTEGAITKKTTTEAPKKQLCESLHGSSKTREKAVFTPHRQDQFR